MTAMNVMYRYFSVFVIALVLIGVLGVHLAQGSPPQVLTMKPTGLSATAVSPTQINLFWSVPTQNYGKTIIGYKIEQQLSPGVFDIIVYNTGSTLTAYSMTGLTTGTAYTYRVSAVYSDDTSTDSSNIAAAIPSATSSQSPTPPVSSATTNVKFDFIPSDGSVLSGVIFDQSDYLALQYKKDPRSIILDVVPTSDPATNSLDNLLSYQNNHLNDNSVPAPLIAKAISSTRISLSWLPPLNQYGQKLLGYEIDLKNAPGDYQVIDENTGNGTTQYYLDGLIPDTAYTYRIFAVYPGTHSNPSNEASATTLEYISPPVQTPDQNASSVHAPSSTIIYDQTGMMPPVANNVQLDFTAPDGVLLSGVILSQSDYQQLVIIKDPRSILSNVTQTSSTINNVLSGILRYQTLHVAKEPEAISPTPVVNSSQSLQQPTKPQSADSVLMNGVITSVVASGIVGIATWFVRTKVARKIAKEYHFTLEHVSSTMSSQIRIRNSGETMEDCVILCEKNACVWTDTDLDKPKHVYAGSVSSVIIPEEFKNKNPVISIKSGKKTLRKIMLNDMAHG
ncbi:MAG TPA: fibronectin type III domain-containing protein [Candidatus Nitrosotalea sp.]|nr:fibronectin type III domain-containing protein [Candidatus Nitrosotalea sp.]